MNNAEALANMYAAGDRAPLTGPERRAFDASALHLRTALGLEKQIAVDGDVAKAPHINGAPAKAPAAAARK